MFHRNRPTDSGGAPSALGFLLISFLLAGAIPAVAAPPSELHILYATVEAGADAIKSVIPDYEKASGIKIVFDTMPYSALQEKAYSELASHSSYYDVICVDTPWFPDLLTHIRPITDFLEDPALANQQQLALADFIPKVFLDTDVYKKGEGHLPPPDLDTISVAGVKQAGYDIWGLPIQSNVLVASYRKDLFEDPKLKNEFKAKYGRDLKFPDTMDELVQVGQFFTRKIGGKQIYGTTLMAKRHESSFCDFKTWLYTYGGKLFDDKMKAVFNNPTGVESLQAYVDLIQKYHITPPGVTTYTWDEVATAFGSGLTAIGFNYHDMALDPKVKGKVGFAMVPGVRVNGRIQRGPHFGSWSLSISAYSKNPEEAFKLIQWLASPENQTKYLKYSQHVTRRSVYANKTVINKYGFGEFYDVMAKSLEVGVGRPRITVYPQVSEAVSIAVNDAASGQRPVAVALDSAASKVDSVMRDAGYLKE